jgi:ribosomal protein S6--L-glutamate ligase
MRIAVLANAAGYYARDLSRVIVARGHEPLVLPFSGLVAREPHPALGIQPGSDEPACSLADVDAVLVRTMPPGSLEQVIFRMNALARLEAAGVIVVNSARAIESAVDKYLTTVRLREAGLPVPRTWVCETAEAALLALEEAGGDVVVKPLFGSEGRGILRVCDPEIGLRVFRTLERIQAVIYLQEFVHHPGWDLRVMVLDGRVLGGMRRYATAGFRTNVSQGGRGEVVAVSECEAEWAIRAAEAVGARIAGVDLLRDETGQAFVIEVNGVPGWKAFRAATGIDVADRLIASVTA